MVQVTYPSPFDTNYSSSQFVIPVTLQNTGDYSVVVREGVDTQGFSYASQTGAQGQAPNATRTVTVTGGVKLIVTTNLTQFPRRECRPQTIAQ